MRNIISKHSRVPGYLGGWLTRPVCDKLSIGKHPVGADRQGRSLRRGLEHGFQDDDVLPVVSVVVAVEQLIPGLGDDLVQART